MKVRGDKSVGENLVNIEMYADFILYNFVAYYIWHGKY